MSEQVCDDVTWSQASDAVALGETHMLDDSDVTDDAARDNDDIVDRKSSSSSKFFSKYLTSSTSPGAKVPTSTSPLRKLTPTQARRKQQQKYQAFPDELLTDDEDGPAARTGYETLQYYTSDSDNDVTDSAPVAEQDTGATSKRGVKKEGLKLKLMGKSQRGSFLLLRSMLLLFKQLLLMLSKQGCNATNNQGSNTRQRHARTLV